MPDKKPLTAAELAKVHMIMPGEHFVSTQPVLIGTLLGSCVAACMWDPQTGMGGMNHFMLPDGPSGSSPEGAPARYGLYAMEVLINDLLRRGCERSRLRTKVFGGANITGSTSTQHIGARNAQFVLRFLADDGFIPDAADLGGSHSRRIYFNTATGTVRVSRVRKVQTDEILALEDRYSNSLKSDSTEGDLTYF